MNATSPPHLCSGTSLPASPSGSASDRQQRMTTAVTPATNPAFEVLILLRGPRNRTWRCGFGDRHTHALRLLFTGPNDPK